MVVTVQALHVTLKFTLEQDIQSSVDVHEDYVYTRDTITPHGMEV